jgi:hypothetical protein
MLQINLFQIFEPLAGVKKKSEEKVEEEEEPEQEGDAPAEEGAAENPEPKSEPPPKEEAPPEPEPAAPPPSNLPKKKLTNQFNFCERGSLTANNPSKVCTKLKSNYIILAVFKCKNVKQHF